MRARRRRSTSGCSRCSTSKCDARIVDAIVKASRLTKADLRDRTSWCARPRRRLQEYFERFAPELVGRDARDHAGHRARRLQDRRAGARRRRAQARPIIDFELMDSPEFAELQALSARAGASSATPPYALEHGDEHDRVQAHRELGERVDELGRKGLHDPALQGPGRDERRAALGDDDGSRRGARCSRCASRTPTRPTASSRS